MKWSEDRIHPQGLGQLRPHQGRAPARGQSYELIRGDPEIVSDRGMDLDKRLWLRGVECGYAAGLSARLIMRSNAPRGQIKRIFIVRFLGRMLIFHRMEARTAIGRSKTLEEDSWGPRMVLVGTRPKDSLLAIDALVSDPCVVGYTARTGPAQLIEDCARFVGNHSRCA